MKIFMCHVKVHKRTSTTEKILNNQVDKMTCPVDVSLCL